MAIFRKRQTTVVHIEIKFLDDAGCSSSKNS